MKKILVPVDFSELSEKVKKAAAYLAEKTNAEIHLLHVTDEVEAGGQQEADQRLKAISSGFNGTTVKTFVTDGVPYDDVVSHSEEHCIDLVLIGSDGTSNYHGTYTASNVLNITRQAVCPVLVIPQNSKEFKIEKVLFVSDFSFEFDYREKVLEICCELKVLVNKFSPEFHLLFIDTKNSNEEKIKTCMNEFADSCGMKQVTLAIENADLIEEGAIKYAKKMGADVIAMVGHGSGHYYTQLRTSISEKVLEQSDRPVMIIRLRDQL